MNCCPFIRRKEANMKLRDKIRIKLKIKKICKILRQLSREEQEESVNRIKECLKASKDWKQKEHFLDMVIERFGVICQ